MQPASPLSSTDALPARLPKGTELAGYVVDGWLRDGGMAAIYRAHRAADGARVALKLQLSSTAQVPEICERFDREAEAMRRVGHEPHVVALHHAGVLGDGRRYFVMEWVDGDNLEEVLDSLRNQDQRLAVREACEIGLDVARGLAVLHEHGLVHRDLKPANVMVARDEHRELRVTLVDFGIVAEHGGGDGGDDEAQAEEEVMGTSAYMPPEQVAGARATPAMDVFALGVVLYEALTGSCVPPDGWSPETLPAIESVRRHVPPELSALVRACMSSDVARRPVSGVEVARRLGEIVVQLRRESLRASGYEIPVRTGSTTLTPRSELVAREEPVVRTGRTEVALTHEQVLGMSGAAAVSEVETGRSGSPAGAAAVAKAENGRSGSPAGAAAVAKAAEVGRSSGSMESMAVATVVLEGGVADERPSRRWWLAVLVVVPLVGGGLWVLGRGGDEDGGGGSSATAMGSEAAADGSSSAAGKDVRSDEAASASPSIPAPAPAAMERGPTAIEPVVAPGEPSPAAAGGEGALDVDEAGDAADAAKADETSPRRGSTKTVPSRPKGPDKAACEKLRAEATAAKKRRHWSGVLEATKQAACWKDAAFKLDRRRLRVEAYAEMANYTRCVEEGRGSTDGQIVARLKWCSKKLGVGG